MTISLNTYAAGDTSYVSKFNLDNSAITSAVNVLQQDLNALKAASSAGADLDFRLNAFNFVINGGFDYWQRGVNTRPDAWEIENESAGFSVSRSTTQTKLGTYSAKTVGEGQLTQSLPDEIRNGLDTSFSITFGAWIYTNADDRARVGIYNGIVTQWSNYHDGGSGWEFWNTSLVQGSGTIPTEIKFILDSSSGTVYWAGVVSIKGNPNASPLFIANPPELEELRVFSMIESGKASIRGVGMLDELLGTREITTRVRFMVPKRTTPTIILEEEATGFEISYENEDKYGFDLNVTDLDGSSGTNGFEYTDIEWRAEV